MSNLAITSICNMRCPYCFAEEHMRGDGTAPDFISVEAFEARLDFLERSGIDEIRLIGGEPTLHPLFPDLVRRARLRGKSIKVFSHGLMPEHALVSLESVPTEQCLVLVNMNAMRSPAGPSQAEVARRNANVRRLGPRALLGFNIFEADFDLLPLIQLIEEAGCRRSLRLGLANPILGAQNSYLHPKQYQFASRKIVQFAPIAARYDISLEFDCGFVRCIFSDGDLDVLRESKADFGWRCSPVLDIGITGEAIHCFPLTGRFVTQLGCSDDATTLRKQLKNQTRPYRVAGVYRECSSCHFKLNDKCTGGCLSATIRRFSHTPTRLHVPLPPTVAPAPV